MDAFCEIPLLTRVWNINVQYKDFVSVLHG